jgi:hypothetical protein
MLVVSTYTTQAGTCMYSTVPGHVRTTGACATPVRVYIKGSRAAPGRDYTKGA